MALFVSFLRTQGQGLLFMERALRCFGFLKKISAHQTSLTFTTLLALFNDTQGDKEDLPEFRSWFEGNLGTLSQLLVDIPPILQAVVFLRVMHSWYQDLLTQFTSNQKDLSLATIFGGGRCSLYGRC